jgi:hypothetical protein
MRNGLVTRRRSIHRDRRKKQDSMRAGRGDGAAAIGDGLFARHLPRLSSCRHRWQSNDKGEAQTTAQLLEEQLHAERDGVAGRPARAGAAERRSFAARQPSPRDRGQPMRSSNPATTGSQTAPSCPSSAARVSAVSHGHCHCLAAGLATTTACGLQSSTRVSTAGTDSDLDQKNNRIIHRGGATTERLLHVVSAAASLPPYSTRSLSNQRDRGVGRVHLVRVAETREKHQRDQLADLARSARSSAIAPATC